MRISDWSSDVCSSDLIERARRLLNDRFRMAAQIGNDRIGPFGSNVLGESLWSHAGQRCQIRKPLAKYGIGFPQEFPLLNGGVRKGEMPGIKEIGRASGRERGGKYDKSQGVAVPVQ